MSQNIFDRINLIKDHTTKQEKVIVNFLHNNNINNLSYLSISEFAERVNTADSTVLRFCKKLGLRGYSEFRMLLAKADNSEYNGDDSDFAFRIVSNMSSVLQSTYELINHDEINKAADIILNAKRIYAFGSGNSSVAAEEMRNKFLRLGVHINYIQDNHLQTIATSTLDSLDAIILFSVSGGTKDMINIAESAKKAGIKLIIITNYLKSPLAQHADVLLYVVSKNAPLDGGSLVSKISQLYVIDVISSAIYKKINDAADNLHKTAISVLHKQI